MRSIVMKMKIKMKNRSLIYDINLGTRKNRPRSRHGHEYSKYKKFLSMMMLICIKQHLSNIWSSILSNTEAELKKSVAYKKERVFEYFSNIFCIFMFWHKKCFNLFVIMCWPTVLKNILLLKLFKTSNQWNRNFVVL